MRRSLLTSFWLSLVLCGCESEGGGGGGRFDALTETIEQELQDYGGTSAAAVAVVHRGKIVYARGFGNVNPFDVDSDPVGPDTTFRIGSTSKMLTAIALLQQLENGTTSLDSPYTSVVPGFVITSGAGAATDLTLRHVLEQTSTLVDTTGRPPAGATPTDSLSAFYEGAPYSAAGYFMLPPGTTWDYANDNFNLAGLAAEKLAGEPYADLLQANVLDELGMARTFAGYEEALAAGDYAYDSFANGPVPVIPYFVPSAGVYSNANDLARLLIFLLEGDETVLSTASREAMLAPTVDTGLASIAGIYEGIRYGLGTFSYDGYIVDGGYRPIRLVGHDGEIDGFASLVYASPEHEFGFVSLANIGDVYLDRSLATALSIVADLPPAEAPPALAPDPAEFDRYAGTYWEPTTLGEISVVHTNGELALHIPSLDGTANYSIGPEFGRTFFFNNVQVHPQYPERRTTFVVPATGPATYLRNRWWIATRQ